LSPYPENIGAEVQRGISLHELNSRIQRAISANFPEPLWLRAEIASLKVRKGHRYFQLVEKDGETDSVKAKAFASLWSGNFIRLRKDLGDQLDPVLKEGLEVLVSVKVTFHPQFGFNLQIQDIDPAFTIGKYFSRKQQIFNKIREKGLEKIQKTLSPPYVLQKIAVISSSGAAGYRDFVEQIRAASHIMDVKPELFDCAMQGKKVESDIINALEKISKEPAKWDTVVMIRGGGAKLDLADFDNFKLAEKIARFPIAILSGIGHETDQSAVDLVAFKSLKTPTATAQYIIDHNLEFLNRLSVARETILQSARQKIADHFYNLRELQQELKLRSDRPLAEERFKIRQLSESLKIFALQALKNQRNNIQNLERELQLSSPVNILKRGFSITSHKGKVLRSKDEVKIGDRIKVKLFKGELTAINQSD
jgi:exodeoxyribonuclease VII large subunit